MSFVNPVGKNVCKDGEKRCQKNKWELLGSSREKDRGKGSGERVKFLWKGLKNCEVCWALEIKFDECCKDFLKCNDGFSIYTMD